VRWFNEKRKKQRKVMYFMKKSFGEMSDGLWILGVAGLYRVRVASCELRGARVAS
jgi:hypothetical protein